jgi:hypothetical protein
MIEYNAEMVKLELIEVVTTENPTWQVCLWQNCKEKRA